MNQNPEQKARDLVGDQLIACGRILQDKKSFNLATGIGVGIRENQTEACPADAILFVNRKPAGVVEAQREEVMRLKGEEQSAVCATAKLKYINNDPLPFGYESTGELTRLTGYRHPGPRSRAGLSYHCPHAFVRWRWGSRSLQAGHNTWFLQPVVSRLAWSPLLK